MKTIALLFLSLFMAKGCSQDEKKDLANAEIIYTANTRGYYQKVTIHNQEITISKDRNEEGAGTTTKISEANWNELVLLFNKLDLEKLSSYEGPTQKRFYDGAAIANMKVSYKEKEYQTNDFDHGTPPLEIEYFVKKLLLLAIHE
ncbi:hypothetical protein [Flavobacterium sp.]|jgi:hypothetical protein|uniref:hypothetical protein n=1 Tax=Flavobacterium sp. TaxID=239 RepID=UPI00333ED230